MPVIRDAVRDIPSGGATIIGTDRVIVVELMGR
jgi:hypothetical protein